MTLTSFTTGIQKVLTLPSEYQMPEPKILSIGKIFEGGFIEKLHRPDYQRPYKWQEKQVIDLLSDLRNDMLTRHKVSFLGTITAHKDENENLNIVDGLQRLTTLYLILCCLDQNSLDKTTVPNFFDQRNDESLLNVQRNYNTINSWLQDNGNTGLLEHINTSCYVGLNTVNTLDEAFQVYEGRNTKGKELKPHDLLKAFHYRKMLNNYQKLRKSEKKLIVNWEIIDESDLHLIFQTLFRIRAWSKGNFDVWDFIKEVRQEFHGLDPKSENARLTPIQSFYLDLCEQYRKPYFIISTLLNGEYFFQWTTKQKEQFIWFKNEINEGEKTSFDFKDETINSFFTYKGKNRTGDQHCQAVLKALLLLYRDRFVNNDSEIHQKNYKKLFNFVYSQRIENYQKKVDGKGPPDRPITVKKMIRLIQESRIFEKIAG